MRRATVIAAVAVAAVAVLAGGGKARAAPRKNAELLGEAYRAYEAGEYAKALRVARRLSRNKLHNADYATYVIAQSAFLTGNHRRAMAEFSKLAADRRSRFRNIARWRVADCAWELGQKEAARKQYERLAGARRPAGDPAVARYRIAESYATSDKDEAIRGFRELRNRHPAHPLAERAERRLVELGGAAAAELSARDRIERAQRLKREKHWHDAIAELAMIGDDVSEDLRRERDFWRGMTYFKMRRRYKDASGILLGLYKHMGDRAAEALFHGARALSRADFDAEAVGWYQRVVEEYPRSRWAPEAQFLSGWLEFNMGHYDKALPYLKEMQRRFPRSRFAVEALWNLGMSHFLLGQYREALPQFEELAKRKRKLEGGKGQYWQARSLDKLGRSDEAVAEYRDLVGRFPFSWYALLARSRLAEKKIRIGPFGDRPLPSDSSTAIDEKPSPALAKDPLIRAVDELIAAGLGVEAGFELRRAERAFIKRHPRSAALATLMDRYKRAGNYHRPWMMGVVYGGWRALNAPPKDRARIWWEHAYPLAYRTLVEKWRELGGSPKYYLYAIMRKESGFDPHVHSHANAIGLVQMIPPTTRRVVKELGLEYTDDLLFDPELNLRTGSWYIGRLFSKFKKQVPLAAGSFNAGPRAVMRWADKNGGHPIDEFVELVSYSQARGYMKKVTETYARYLYLYDNTIYEQPLTVDPEYVADKINY